MSNYHYPEDNNFPKAFAIASAIFIAFILLSFFYIISSRPTEFGTGGILVNYGTSDEGMGNDFMALDEPSVAPNANQTLPDKVVPETETAQTPTQERSDKSVVTQDIEDAPTVITKVKEKASSSTPVVTPEKKNTTLQLNQNALYKGKKKNGTGSGDGTGTTPGNQGSINGSNLTNTYGEGGSGFGLEGLPNRSFTQRPNLNDNGQQSGTVIVEITVDKSGTITNARAGVRGTTLVDKELWDKCETAVRNAHMNGIGASGPESQVGRIVFNFKVR